MSSAALTQQATYRSIAHAIPVVLGCALLVLSAKIIIPVYPVPVSLQTVAVLFIGLLYSRPQAIQSVAAYLGLGALGFPVFTGTSGPLVFMGPTGGYLMGFLAAVMVMTFVRDKWLSKSTAGHQMALCVMGTVTVYALGIGSLSVLMGFQKAIALGLLPFILPAIIKIMILASLLKLYRTVIKHAS